MRSTKYFNCTHVCATFWGPIGVPVTYFPQKSDKIDDFDHKTLQIMKIWVADADFRWSKPQICIFFEIVHWIWRGCELKTTIKIVGLSQIMIVCMPEHKKNIKNCLQMLRFLVFLFPFRSIFVFLSRYPPNSSRTAIKTTPKRVRILGKIRKLAKISTLNIVLFHQSIAQALIHNFSQSNPPLKVTSHTVFRLWIPKICLKIHFFIFKPLLHLPLQPRALHTLPKTSSGHTWPALIAATPKLRREGAEDSPRVGSSLYKRNTQCQKPGFSSIFAAYFERTFRDQFSPLGNPGPRWRIPKRPEYFQLGG